VTGRDGSMDEVAWFGFRTESEQCSGQQEQNAPRLFAQLDDGAIAAQFFLAEVLYHLDNALGIVLSVEEGAPVSRRA